MTEIVIKARPKTNAGGSSKYEQAKKLPNGTYPARLLSVVFMGLQKQQPRNGQPREDQDEVQITYELLDEFLKDENGNEDKDTPLLISERFLLFPLSSERAKGTARYKALDEKMEHGGNWAKLVGKTVMITLGDYTSQAGRTSKIILSTGPMREKDAISAPGLVNDPLVFSAQQPDFEVLGRLPGWLQEKIKESPDMKPHLANVNGETTNTQQVEASPEPDVTQPTGQSTEEPSDIDW